MRHRARHRDENTGAHTESRLRVSDCSTDWNCASFLVLNMPESGERERERDRDRERGGEREREREVGMRAVGMSGGIQKGPLGETWKGSRR